MRDEVARSGRDLVECFTLVHASTPTQRMVVAKGPTLLEMALSQATSPRAARAQPRRAPLASPTLAAAEPPTL